ncbi:MAG: universal stress protein [Actinobacteria bacterium]|nr:universal stress protein [Actinomycetota bacterium]
MGPGFSHVACCVDASPSSDAILTAGRRLVRDDGRLALVHVVSAPLAAMELPAPDMRSVVEDAETWLTGRVDELNAASGDLTFEAVLLHGRPGVAVCEWAETTDVDVLVAGSHRGLLDRALLGSFAGYIAYHAPCAVHLVRPAKPH